MASSIVSTCALALVAAHVASAQQQQIFPGEPTCAISCYGGAIAANNCRPADLLCQCSTAGLAAVVAVGGPCLVANCGPSDLQSFSSAYTAACSSATSAASAAGVPAATAGSPSMPSEVSVAPLVPPPALPAIFAFPTATSSSTSSTATSSTSSSTTSSSSTSSSSTTTTTSTAIKGGDAGAPLPTSPVQEQPSSDSSTPTGGATGSVNVNAGLNQAAIAGISVASATVGLLVGLAALFLTMARRRRHDREQRAQLAREKAAMQTSLEELRLAVSRQGTFDSVSSMEEGAAGGGGGGGYAGSGAGKEGRIAYGRRGTVVLNAKDGPQELMVTEKTYAELQGDLGQWTKT